MKLKFRMSLMIITVLLVVIAAISIILLRRASGMQTKSAARSAENLASAYAMDLRRRFEIYMQTAVVLSQTFDGYDKLDPSERRPDYNDTMRTVLDDNPDYLGIFTAWKPNALDGLDAQYAGTPGTDAGGQYISWFNRNNGDITLEAYEGYRESLDALDHYRTISNPRFQRVEDRDILVVDVTVPITSDETGELEGLVGVNIDISAMEEIVGTIKPFETGMATVYSNDGTVAAHNVHEKTGFSIEVDRDLYKDKTEEVLAAIQEGRTYKLETHSDSHDDDLHIIMHPFVIAETKTPWSLMVAIPMDKVLEEVHELTAFTIGLSLIILLLVGVGLFFLISAIVKPIVTVALTLKDISEGEGDLTKTDQPQFQG